MVVNEFKFNSAKDMVDGVAAIDFRFTTVVKGTSLLLFFGGGLLLVEVRSKTQVRSSWHKSLKKTLLNQEEEM